CCSANQHAWFSETAFMMPSRPRLPLTGHALIDVALLGTLFSGTAAAIKWPVTDEQRDTANQVAQAGVPLAELAPNAPDSYTIKRGDTLWDISKLFLRSPWR